MNNFLVFQSDFGLCDAAIGEMEGVVFSINPNINIRHLCHQIGEYNIFEASYRLFQTIDYWPTGTTFVSIVDPGVGSDRLSVVAKTKSGQYIVTPNNGTLSHVHKFLGIEEVRIIDETKNRLKGSNESYTFHGRDVYAYTGARLASNTITFEEVGPVISNEQIVMLEICETKFVDNKVIGQVDLLDSIFGSLWTSIDIKEFKQLGINIGEYVNVEIKHNNESIYKEKLLYGHSFADVEIGKSLVYMNSLNHIGIAINQGNFSKTYNVLAGKDYIVEFNK